MVSILLENISQIGLFPQSRGKKITNLCNPPRLGVPKLSCNKRSVEFMTFWPFQQDLVCFRACQYCKCMGSNRVVKNLPTSAIFNQQNHETPSGIPSFASLFNRQLVISFTRMEDWSAYGFIHSVLKSGNIHLRIPSQSTRTSTRLYDFGSNLEAYVTFKTRIRATTTTTTTTTTATTTQPIQQQLAPFVIG